MPNILIIWKKPAATFEIPAPPEPSLTPNYLRTDLTHEIITVPPLPPARPAFLNTLISHFLTPAAPPPPFEDLGSLGPYPPINNPLSTELSHAM